MSSGTDRFIQAVRLALQKRDFEKRQASPSAHLPGTHDPSNSRSAPQSKPMGRDHANIHEISPHNSAVLDAIPKQSLLTGRGARGVSARNEKAAIIDSHPENGCAVRQKRRLVSMFEEEDDITPQQVEGGSRLKSDSSSGDFHENGDVVVLDDDSDDECIDLTGLRPEPILDQVRTTAISTRSRAGPSTLRAEDEKVKVVVHAREEQSCVGSASPLDSSIKVSKKPEKRLRNDQEKPSTKRKKKEKEKRSAKYRSAPSKAALDRLERSRGHRLFLVDKTNPGDSIRCAVMGSNGNIYKCVIDLEPHCDCPDFRKRKGTSQQGPCKHLIFIFMRVLKLDCEDPRWWQKCLVQSELDGLIDIAQQTHNPGTGVLADQAVRAEYQRAVSSNKENPRRSLEGECTICYEDLVQNDGNQRPENVITFCKACGNNFHSACLENWFRAQSKRTCPLCRAKMDAAGDKPGGSDPNYLNLAQHSSAHEQQLTLEQRYADTHMYIGNRRGRGRRGAPRRGGA
eukprot:GFKZ01013467.1.p1 GENE.GFKZ01013467.1~~GFKZ01013467.1.p1  ORF type:complete len:512 (+),score=58.56 GFKZ01013467.1:270-1805(+)